MEDDDRKALYAALLRGIADVAQDRQCAADKNHAWGKWTRYVVQPDMPRDIGPVTGEAPVMDETYRVAARRQCLNCGREDFSA